MSGVLLVVRLVIVHLATVTLAIHSINIQIPNFPLKSNPTPFAIEMHPNESRKSGKTCHHARKSRERTTSAMDTTLRL